MSTRTVTSSIALLTAALLCGSASADTYRSVMDTYIYEFLGNQGTGSGDSGGMLVWNHENVHGAQALIQIDEDWVNDPALMGSFTATLNLYQACVPGGFIGACVGDAGAEVVNTDIILQGTSWMETDPLLGWANISQTGPTASFQQTEALGWVSVDVTALVQLVLDGAPDFGFSLSQEAYPVTRTDTGSIAVSAFCDRESTTGTCALDNFQPFLSIDGQIDSDGDGITDNADNCIQVANANQIDANGDGYGNACDADLNGDCTVNAVDLGLFRLEFFGTDPNADFNSDGTVNVIDLGILRTLFFATPGPSGTTSACD